MRQTKLVLALLSAIALAACGGGSSSSSGDQSVKTRFSAQVSFGDSLSDVGTYKVGTVKALGGGLFNINGDLSAANPAMTGKNWTELLAAQLGLPAPCPAVTGLDGDASMGFAVATVAHAGCYGYAEGGARVTNPVGTGNKLTGSPLGALTMPVAAQIQNHLSLSGGKFKGDELVLVWAGANDVFEQLAGLSANATAAGNAVFGNTLVGLLAAGATSPQAAAQAIGTALLSESARPGHTDATVVGAAVGAAAVQPGNSAVASSTVYGPMVVQAQAAGAKAGAAYLAANGASLVAAMATAATELTALVQTQVIGKGANFVVVNNLPDIGTTPLGRSFDANTLALVNLMVKTYNDTLNAGVGSNPKVAYIDAFAASHDQATNPGPYGLTNVTTPACDLTPAKNPLASSLVCNGSNLVAGDVSHYSFSDTVHPTPFVHFLLTSYVSRSMLQKGWL